MLQTRLQVVRVVPKCPKMSNLDALLSERTYFYEYKVVINLFVLKRFGRRSETRGPPSYFVYMNLLQQYLTGAAHHSHTAIPIRLH